MNWKGLKGSKPLWGRKGKDKYGRSISDEAFTKRLKKRLEKEKKERGRKVSTGKEEKLDDP